MNGPLSYWHKVVRDAEGDMVELPRLFVLDLFAELDRHEAHAREASRVATLPESRERFPRYDKDRHGW